MMYVCVFSCLYTTEVQGAEVVLSGEGKWVVSEGTQTGEETDLVQITVPLQQVPAYVYIQ